MCLKVILSPFVGNLGQDVVRLLMLVFGIADHHLDHRWLKLRQCPYTRAELLYIREIVFNKEICIRNITISNMKNMEKVNNSIKQLDTQNQGEYLGKSTKKLANFHCWRPHYNTVTNTEQHIQL